MPRQMTPEQKETLEAWTDLCGAWIEHRLQEAGRPDLLRSAIVEAVSAELATTYANTAVAEIPFAEIIRRQVDAVARKK